MATDQDAGPETVGMATATVERGHERRDANVRAILAVAGGLVAIAALVQVVLYFQVRGLWRVRQHALPPPLPAASALPDAPPEPRLETAPALDLRALRSAEDAHLGAYGWVDRGAGIVHVPIDRAMDLVAQEAARESGPASPERGSPEAEGESPHAGLRGPGASEQRIERSERAAHGPAGS